MIVADPETRAGIEEYHRRRARIEELHWRHLARLAAEAAVSDRTGPDTPPAKSPGASTEGAADTSTGSADGASGCRAAGGKEHNGGP